MDKIDGFGKFIGSNYSYSGFWIGNRKQGQGVFTNKDGDVYEG